jgi:glycosyltransferase involved in cell wall biosynthesis
VCAAVVAIGRYVDVKEERMTELGSVVANVPSDAPVSRRARALTLSVVVPVYNERYLVRELLQRVLAVRIDGISAIEVIVVDDCSTDGTRELLRTFVAEHGDGRMRLLEQSANQGKGAAVRRGIADARGDLIVFQDADLEYDPRDYARLVRPFFEDDADVVFGSRFAVADRRRVLYFRHALGNRLLTLLTNWATDLTLSDMETCYKMFRSRILKSIPIRSNRFGIEPELTLKAAKRNLRIFEVPVNYSGRTYREGKKITWKDGFSALATIARFSLQDDLYAEDEYGSHILVSLERTRRFNRWMAEALMPNMGARVLEIGAGIGNISHWLMPRDRYVASDINPFYLDYLSNGAINRPYMEVMRIDLNDASTFAGIQQQFDTIVCLNVLEHVPDPLLALRNMHSALVDGGRALIYVPQGPWLYSSLDEVLGHRCRYTPEALRSELEATGFIVESITGFNRVSVPGWYVNGRILKRSHLSRVQLKIFDMMVPVLRHVDQWIPLPAIGIIAVARKTGS